eukprot:GHVN01092960.1.p1 GENE.GHVN01092960.1~~GHVN01092960.1.p1  ORF type:complete len:117 (+),score=21.59 GHVN01092960.1:221-571(+)
MVLWLVLSAAYKKCESGGEMPSDEEKNEKASELSNFVNTELEKETENRAIALDSLEEGVGHANETAIDFIEAAKKYREKKKAEDRLFLISIVLLILASAIVISVLLFIDKLLPSTE